MQIRAKRREKIGETKSDDVLQNDDSSSGRHDDGGSLPRPSSSLSLPLPKLFVCVYCGAPCSALYRQLNMNSLSSIKAMNCERCHRIVDPYIEREWLLVAIDCILLRPEAYRHILYNNQDLSRYTHVQKKEERGQQQVKGNRNLIKRLVEWTFMSSILHAYLKLKSLPEDAEISSILLANGNSSMLVHATFVLTSALDLVAQWLAIYGFMKLFSRESEPNSATSLNSAKHKDDGNDQQCVMLPSHSIAYQIYLGLILPTSFQIISVLVLLWEDSKTTRAFGSLLIACWQCLGISLISMNNGSKPKAKKIVLRGFTPLMGFISLIAWRFAIDRFILTIVCTTSKGNLLHLHRTIPCVGYEMDIFNDVISDIAHGEFGSSAGWASKPLLLCLT